MDFLEVIDQSKQARVEVQSSQVPFLPPGFILTFEDDTPKASVLCFKPDEQSITGMLALLPALHADGIYLTFEGYVRPIGNAAAGPIAEDPMSQPAVINIHVARSGKVETALSPYSINESGYLVWASPGAVESPAVPKLVEAIENLFKIDIQGEHVAVEVCNWLAINGYLLQIHPGLIPEEDR